jgi:hypothetical protein
MRSVAGANNTAMGNNAVALNIPVSPAGASDTGQTSSALYILD